MKTKQIILLTLVAAFCLSGCTNNFETRNRNPHDVTPEEAERDGYMTSARLRTMQNNVISTDVNRAHQTDILLGGAYGRYASESKANTWNEKFSTFNAPDNWSNVMFNEVMPNVYPAYNELRVATENPVILSVAEIIKVMAMHRVTDAYGPIPYSKISMGAIQTPYDSQRDVYMKMFEELDAAIATLTENQNRSLIRSADLIYGGDVVKWIKLANSVKLRLAMRIVYAEPAIAQARAEEAVNHTIGVMADNTDNAALTTFGADGNPFNTAVKYNDGDNRSVADMTTYMNAYNDPRRASYFVKSGFTGAANEYVGYRSGINIGGVSQFSRYSVFNINEKSPLQWMNVAEVMFLKAEGALRGWNMGGTADSFYEQAIGMSFTQWGAADVSTYLANSTGYPSGYTDPANAFSYNTLLTTVTVAWNPADDFERSLERIIIQKWLANFPLGHEAWADRRRTGYPTMIPVMVNKSPNGVLPDNGIPRRCPYPAQEAVTNAKNYNDAVVMLRGRDNLATRLWWDCKP